MESFFKLSKDKKESSKNEGYINQAQHLWSMLDDMASSNPDSYKKFIEKTLQDGKEALKPPEPHMCIKTTLIEPKKCNLFINVFSWKKIPAPKTDTDPIPVFGRDIEYLNNLSVINIAFSTEVLEKYGKNSDNREETEMLINLAFQYIQNQNNVRLNEKEFKILGSDCYGDPKECVSKLTKNDKTNMSDLDLAKEALSSINANEKQNLPDSILNKLVNLGFDDAKNVNRPEQSSFVEDAPKKSLIQELSEEDLAELPAYEEKIISDKDDLDKAYYEVKINLPKVKSFSECDLNIDNNFLILNANKLYYKELKISLLNLNEMYAILSDIIEAKFVKKTLVLRVKIPLLVKKN